MRSGYIRLVKNLKDPHHSSPIFKLSCLPRMPRHKTIQTYTKIYTLYGAPRSFFLSGLAGQSTSETHVHAEFGAEPKGTTCMKVYCTIPMLFVIFLTESKCSYSLLMYLADLESQPFEAPAKNANKLQS